tara:strand:- start:1797 stop:2813 length:1017 start_codon:yes stop_codon:yes gene_type:complete
MTQSIQDKLEKYFRSSDLANLSDFIFSETVSINEFQIKNKNFFVVEENKELVTYINPIVSISDGDIIFSKTDYVKILFNLLQKSSVKDITLITHQSDIKINNNLYNKKPKAISRWFSVNASIEKKDLFAIPIGFANTHYKKNLNPELFDNKLKSFKKNNLIYINYNSNTNYFEREKIIKTYENNENFVIGSSNSSLKEYGKDLEKYKFVICPPGNGIQTHRLWEALYFGAIPVVKNNILYKNFKNLNIVFVESFKNLTVKNLNNSVISEVEDYRNIFKKYKEIIFDQRIIRNKNLHNLFVSKQTLNQTLKKYNFNRRVNKYYKPLRAKFYKIYSLITD